jgi:two-component system response regulator AtoC
MPEPKRIRALLAVTNPVARSAVEAYVRTRPECTTVLMPQVLSLQTLSLDALLARVAAEHVDLVLLEDGSGSDLLEGLRNAQPSLPIVAIIPNEPDAAFRAARLGAVDILTLPLNDDELASKLDRVIDTILAALALGVLPVHDKAVDHPEPFVEPLENEFPNSFNTSPRMAEIRDMIEKVATTSATVLIRGESGVGKEIVARMIFTRSERSHKAFVKVNCAAIPNELLESELFGFEAGAFTGAQRAKPGKFEMADGGTMFLDEIAEMHPMLQAKLLHVLQDGEFSRLGSKHDTSVDVRVICATNKLLEQRVSEGLFREDLFYRINVVTIQIPPLRERRDEIPVLLEYFIRKYSRVYRRTVAPLDEHAMRLLLSYSWPGNIRELENLCKRYVIVGGSAQIVRELSARAESLTANGSPAPQTDLVEAAQPSLLEIGRQAAWRAERKAIQDMLAETQWNRKEAARRLRVSYKALLNKIEQIANEDQAQKINLST